jgi:N-formylglutamate amidohydrolase
MHGFKVDHDVPGYSGAHTVRRLGRANNPHLDAIQIEINSGMLMTMPRREYFSRIDRGEDAEVKHEVLAKLQACVREVVQGVGDALQNNG